MEEYVKLQNFYLLHDPNKEPEYNAIITSVQLSFSICDAVTPS